MTASLDMPTIRTPADLLAVVPYVVGFHPADSVVALGLRGTELTFSVRADLPGPGETPDPLARYLAGVIQRQRVDGVALVGYGSAPRVDPMLDALRHALAVPVRESLRVTGSHYWSLFGCDDSACCDPEGTPFDVSASEVAAAATYSGSVALPDRAALVARLAPVDGPARVSMRAATERAGQRLRDVASGALGVRRAGRHAVREAVARHRAGGVLTDDEVAWLTVLLRTTAVRDYAWEAVTDPELHMALWTDVVRRAEPELVAAPAGLLSFAAWRSGDGALASIAVARALDADPADSLALLMDDILVRAIPPSTMVTWPQRDLGTRRAAGGTRRRSPAVA